MQPMKPDSQQLYPLLFEPVLKDYIWGGQNLERRLGRQLPPDKNIAESWEIAAHENGNVRVINGPLAGETLADLNQRFGAALVGQRGKWALERQKFPLLIKLLDANRNLSVQVHPDDEYALKREGNELGKTEMWVILHAEDDAAIILGVKEQTTPQVFREALEAGRLEQHLHEIPVATGDFVCVPSGSLHAILGGVLIAEIQQNSDVTYRVYDWNRVGQNGKPRPLHVDQAMEVINFQQVEPALPMARSLTSGTNPINRSELCRNPYFVVERVKLAATARYEGQCNGETLHIWGVINGAVHVAGANDSEAIDMDAVRFTLLPAGMGSYSISTGDRPAQLLHAYLT